MEHAGQIYTNVSNGGVRRRRKRARRSTAEADGNELGRVLGAKESPGNADTSCITHDGPPSRCGCALNLVHKVWYYVSYFLNSCR